MHKKQQRKKNTNALIHKLPLHYKKYINHTKFTIISSAKLFNFPTILPASIVKPISRFLNFNYLNKDYTETFLIIKHAKSVTSKQPK